MRGRLSFLRRGAGRVGYGGRGLGARAPRTPRAGASDQVTGGLSGCHGGRPPEPARASRTQGPPKRSQRVVQRVGWWPGGLPARAPRAGPLFESRTPRTQLPKDRRAGASNQDPIRRATALLVHEDKHITAAFSGMERRSVEGIRKSLEPSGGDRRGRGVTILLHHFYIQECV